MGQNTEKKREQIKRKKMKTVFWLSSRLIRKRVGTGKLEGLKDSKTAFKQYKIGISKYNCSSAAVERIFILQMILIFKKMYLVHFVLLARIVSFWR